MTALTGIPVIDWFLGLLEAWGYALVFAFTVFENLFVVGSLTPGETVVIAAALLSAKDLLSITGVWSASVVGTMTGANLSYWLGRRAGVVAMEDFVERFAASKAGRLFRIKVESVNDVYEHFHTDGSRTVLLARFAAGVKNFVPAIAGATRMPVLWFEIYSLIGAIVYTSLMCTIGWFLGENMDYALAIVRRVTLGGLLVFAAFAISAVYARRRIKARRAARLAAGEEVED